MTEVLRATVSRAEFQGDGLIRGVASTIGNVDRMRRVFLPGAFGQKAFRVPLLAFHDEKRPLGSSLLTPQGSVLRHESQLANIPEAETIRELIKAGGIPATSIGWLPGGHFGWRALEKAQPMLARQSAAAGVPQREDVLYFDSAEVVENSVVPIPANPMALIAVASMLPSEERGVIQDMLEMAAGSRHSRSDAELIQAAHDHMAKLGASCSSTAAFHWTTPNQLDGETAAAGNQDNINGLATAVDDAIDEAQDELQQGNLEEARSALQMADSVMDDLMEALGIPDTDEDEAGLTRRQKAAAAKQGKPRFSMPDGSFPISACTGENSVESAAKLAHHSKTYPFAKVRRHVMRAKSALNCPDSVLPTTWNDSQGAAQEAPEPSLATEQAAVVELPDLAALEQELAQLT